MSKIDKFLRIAALLIVAVAVVGIGFQIIFLVRDKCLALVQSVACRALYLCLSALFVYSVGLVSLLLTKRIWGTRKS